MIKNTHSNSHNNNLYIGLMSGTSMDGIDCVLTEIINNKVNLIDSLNQPIPKNLYKKLYELVNNEPEKNQNYNKFDLINLLFKTDAELGEVFANAVLEIISKNNLSSSQIAAIGSHGQTIYHNPSKPNGFTLQIGNPHVISAKTKITTISNFRNLDIAYGGQGAPLVPIFHKEVFMDKSKIRAIINIGGIANITYLNPIENKVIGFDTGPGNTLLDVWYQKYNTDKSNLYDTDGDFAKSGKVNHELLNIFLDDPYFYLSPPKSTGREYFNQQWLNKYIQVFNKSSPEDIQRTLVELTAITISQQISKFCPNVDEIYFCGGGIHNKLLMQRIKILLNNFSGTTCDLNIPADWVEAMAFAYFAYMNINKIPVNLKDITGSSSVNSILGSTSYY